MLTNIKLFFSFFRIGLFTFGGGMAMLPLLEQEMLKHGLKKDEILDFFSLGQTLPGVIAINSATLVGRRVNGFGGALFATIGVVLPSYLVIILIVLLFQRYLAGLYVQSALSGIRATAAALIISSGFSISLRTLLKIGPEGRIRLSFYSLFIFLFALLLLIKDVNPFYIILASIVLGIGRYGVDSLLKKGSS